MLLGKIKRQATRTSSFPIITEHTTQSESFHYTPFNHKLNPQNLIHSDINAQFSCFYTPLHEKKIIICIFLKHLNFTSTRLFMQVHNRVLKFKYFRKKKQTQKKRSEDKPVLEAAASTNYSEGSF